MINLLGGAGNSNFGDELIVRAWLDYLQARNPHDAIVVDWAGHDHTIRSMNHILSEYTKTGNVSFENTLDSLGRLTKKPEFWTSFQRGLNFFERGGFSNYSQYKHIHKRFSNVKIMHMHGGGFLNAIWPVHAFKLGLMVAAKRKFDCKIVATGIGLIPFPDVPQNLLRDFRDAIAEFDCFETRDVESFDLLRRYCGTIANIFCGLDDTFLLPQTLRRGESALHVSHFGDPSHHHTQRLLEQLKDHHFSMIYFWACTPEDTNFFQFVRDVFPNATQLSLRDLVLQPLPVSIGDFMVTSRFHPHLLAARLGAIGVYTTNTSNYYKPKHESIIRLGSPFIFAKDSLPILPQHDRLFLPMPLLDNMRIAQKIKIADYIYGHPL